MDFLNTPEKLNRRMIHNPMGRFGEAVEQAKAVVFCESASRVVFERDADCWDSGIGRLVLYQRNGLPRRWRSSRVLRREYKQGWTTAIDTMEADNEPRRRRRSKLRLHQPVS
jgi:hypothetical protein